MSNAGRPDVELRPETLEAIEAVRGGLELAMRREGAAEVTTKEGRDLVTGTDVAVEDAVRASLTAALGLPVVGEERGGEAPADGSAYWLVDPICGTSNFAAGTPLYCVNLALVEQGEATAAVVGDASLGEIVVAERGKGAWALKDGAARRLGVSDESRTVVADEGKSTGERREQAARFMAQVIRADRWHFRSLGTTLTLPYVAAGRLAAYAVFWVTAVHVAAGSLLVTEAGGVISDVQGEPWTLQSDSMLVSANQELQAALLALADTSNGEI